MAAACSVQADCYCVLQSRAKSPVNCPYTVWQFDSKERLGNVFVLRQGVRLCNLVLSTYSSTDAVGWVTLQSFVHTDMCTQ
jgi:hypothetical protein